MLEDGEEVDEALFSMHRECRYNDCHEIDIDRQYWAPLSNAIDLTDLLIAMIYCNTAYIYMQSKPAGVYFCIYTYLQAMNFFSAVVLISNNKIANVNARMPYTLASARGSPTPYASI